MKIFRATNTSVIKYIEPKIRPADGVSKEVYISNLESWLLYAPDTIFVQVIFGEDSKLLAFMICYLPPSVNFMFLSQLWSEERKHAAMLFLRAVEWADMQGRTQIRLESESDHDGYGDLWKFDTITTTKAKNFTDMTSEWFEQLVFEKLEEKDNSNGIPSGTPGGDSVSRGLSLEPAEEQVNPDKGTERHQPETGEVLPGAVSPVHG